MARSLFDPDHRVSLIRRLQGLDAADRPRWGQLTPPALMGHLLDSFALARGDITIPLPKGFLTTWLGRWVIINSPLPWPRGVQVPDELFATGPGDFEADRTTVIRELEAFAREEQQRYGIHPLMGQLSRRQWGQLGARHLDHHLKQFGH